MARITKQQQKTLQKAGALLSQFVQTADGRPLEGIEIEEAQGQRTTVPCESRIDPRVRDVIEHEEEMPGPMPDDQYVTWLHVALNKAAFEDALRGVVRATKQSILRKLEAL